MKTDIYTQARHIAELLRTALKSDTQAATVLSAELHDILRDDLGWTSAKETDELCAERDSLADEVDSLKSQLESD